jgi:hypothetical protein
VPEEVVLPFPQPIKPLLHVRSTLLLGGLQSLRDAGLGHAYDATVPPEVREVIVTSVAGMWLPVATAVAHYLACDRIGVSAESAAQIGRGTFERTKGLLLGTAISLAKSAGATPWTLFPHVQRFWLRGNDGGGLRVFRLGPKEARLDVVGCPIFASRYYRAAFRGLCGSVIGLVSRRVYVHEQPVGDADSAVTMRIQWV